VSGGSELSSAQDVGMLDTDASIALLENSEDGEK
jgi:hypothetical protein